MQIPPAGGHESPEAAAARCKELFRISSVLVPYMSHEFRGPLNVILGFANILKEDVQGSLNEEQRESVDAILRGGEQLLAMIGDMVAVLRELLQPRPAAVAVNVQELAADIVEEFSPVTSAKGLELAVVADEELFLETDRPALQRSLRNLVDNAVKFTESGRVEIVLGSRDDSVTLEVRDNGIGIPAADIPRLFDSCVRLHTSGGEKVPGTGLGLLHTALLVRYVLQGEVICCSSPGAGSAFTITVPRRRGGASA